MGEIKLKSCPFCKTKPYTRITGIKGEELNGYISCNNPECGIKMDFLIKPEHILLGFEDVIKGLREVEEKWNNRAVEDGKVE